MSLLKFSCLVFGLTLIFLLSFNYTIFADEPHQNLSLATSASYCGNCHQTEYQQWRLGPGTTGAQGTMHFLSALDPMYLAMKTLVPPELLLFCQGCHEPNTVWDMNDWINETPQAREVNVEEGTNCLVCHLSGSSISTSSQIKQSVFCASCHNEASGAVNTYSEWLVDYGAKKSCQSCHMPNGMHTWLGANSLTFLKNSVTLKLAANSSNTVKAIVKLKPKEVGHSVPSSVVRKLILEVKLLRSDNSLISQQEFAFYKRFGVFGENVSQNNALKANEEKVVEVNFGPQPEGSYTVEATLKHQLNRFFPPYGEQLLKRKELDLVVE